MLKPCENWLFPVKKFVHYARQTHDIYQPLPYAGALKPIE